jgi:hypothetical protein
MVNENPYTSPILFPGYYLVTQLNQELLSSASFYDTQNPNLITRLVPPHYILEEKDFNGSSGNQSKTVTGNGPGTAPANDTFMMLSFLYIFARFFDDIKLYVDAFSNLTSVDYDTFETVPDNFLLNLINNMGFKLPSFFNDASLDQYINGESISDAYSTDSNSLKFVQSQLLRRILVNMPDIIKSKGTLHSIKSFFRSVGIDPDNSLRIKEYGGPTSRSLKSAREYKIETGAGVIFSGSSCVISPYLSGSRLEVGYPYPVGPFVNKIAHPPHGISSYASDGLFTSGSWTIEMDLRFAPKTVSLQDFPVTQSLCRLYVTGSSSTPGLITNLVAINSKLDGNTRIQLHVRPGSSPNSPYGFFEFKTPNKTLFDGNRWNVSFGCVRND